MGDNQIMHKILRTKMWAGPYGSKNRKKWRRKIKRKFQQINRQVLEEGENIYFEDTIPEKYEHEYYWYE